MISNISIMKHPDPTTQTKQEHILKNCPPEEREFYEKFFRIGNAMYRYQQLATVPKNKDFLKQYYEEWLEGLPMNIARDMKEKGFEECKTMLSFTRYVNERTDIGLDEWMKEHLSEKDYISYKNGLK